MKILVLSDDFPPDVTGGAGMMAFRLSNEFLRAGHEVRIVTASKDSEKCGTKNENGFTVTTIYSRHHADRWRAYRSLYNPGIVRELERVLTEFKPDIVHAHIVHLYLSYYSLMVAKRYSRVFMTAHDIMPFYPGTFTEFINPKDFSCPKSFDYRVTAVMLIRKFRFRYNFFRNIAIRYILGRIDGVITVSNALEEALTQNGIMVRGVIRNGIKISEQDVLQSEIESFMKNLGVVGSEIVLFGGRLSGAKGGSLILNAMVRVLERVPGAKLLVVGQKDYYAKKMQEKAIQLDISDSIVFAGWLNEAEMAKAYASSSVVTIPSVCFDSFPNGNIEAFAAGKPVVATCFGGSKEIVRNGENGYIVNPFNVTSLSGAIAELLLDKERAKKFGEAGRALVRAEYSIGSVAKKYLTLFSE